jgi:hypothetical protein
VLLKKGHNFSECISLSDLRLSDLEWSLSGVNPPALFIFSIHFEGMKTIDGIEHGLLG